MADGFLQQFPDLAPLMDTITNAKSDIDSLLGAFTSLEDGQSATSPIANVFNVFNDLNAQLDIDMSGLTDALPSSIAIVKNILPAGALEYVESIEGAYTTAQDFLQDSALAKEVTEGNTLQEVALAVIEDALSVFDSRIADLANNMIDTDIVNQIKDVFNSINEFTTDFHSHSDDFLPFITENLMGVSPDLLSEPLEHLNTIYNVFSPLEPESLNTTLNPAHQSITTAFNEITNAIQSLDPSDANGYILIQHGLDQIDTAINTMIDALISLYPELQNLIENHSWDTIFPAYRALLEAIDLKNISSIDHVIDNIADMLEDMLARYFMMFGVDDISERIQSLSQTIYDSFSNSALGQIRQTLLNFITQIQQAIENVPTENIRTTVMNMLNRVKQELDTLGIKKVEENIEIAFNEVETFVVNNINETLKNHVIDEMKLVLDKVDHLPVAEIHTQLEGGDGIEGIIPQLNTLFENIESTLDNYMGDLRSLISQLDKLSFKPLGDEIIEEIDELKSRLQSINPNALSDVEKLAIKTALAFLDRLDLESEVIEKLIKPPYNSAEKEIKELLNKITTVLKRMHEKLGVFSTEGLLKPVTALLDQASGISQRLNGKLLLNPLYAQVDDFSKNLETISPSSILQPLKDPYNTMKGAIERLNPDTLVAPLHSLYQKIDQLINVVDVTPVLDELDQRQKQLFSNIRDAILNALDNLELPEPLSSFFNDIRQLLAVMTDAIFGDPDNEIKNINLELESKNVQINKLFEPLDSVFSRLLNMIESIDQSTLTGTINTIRETIGTGLEALDPSTIIDGFRNGQNRLSELSPPILLGLPLGLPGLKLLFETKTATAPPEHQSAIETTLERFNAIYQSVDPELTESTINRLTQTHEDLWNALRLKINELDATDIGNAYASLRNSLERVLPDFLRNPNTLTYSDVLSGFYSIRPSAKAEKIKRVLERYIQQINPIQEELEPAINSFFQNIRNILLLINPLSIKNAIADFYGTIREKVRILDPNDLSSYIRDNYWDPLIDPINQIDPDKIEIKMNEVYGKIIDVISNNVKQILLEIDNAIDEKFRLIRKSIKSLIDQVQVTMEAAFQNFKNIQEKFEQLVFAELLEQLNRVIDNLGISFEKELSRVRNSFNQMIAAIPV